MNLQSTTATSVATKSTPSASDMDVVKRVREGDIEAFEVIMRRHNQRLYRIARSILREEHEALDVVQETYVKAYYQLDQFKGPDGFASWLSQIARNEALTRLRKSSRVVYTLDDPEHAHIDMESTTPLPMDDIATQQLRKLLEDAIDTLPIDYRCVYVMRAIQQLSTIETANSLDVTEQVVKTRYLRAKRALQKVFEGHLEKAGLMTYEFAGQRCDTIVQTVMERLQNS